MPLRDATNSINTHENQYATRQRDKFNLHEEEEPGTAEFRHTGHI